MTTQLITPNPDIPAEEGMCLQYVRQAFGLPPRYGSATEAWNNSPSQHPDRDCPQGVWFPVWWALDKNVNGHVALVAPDGSVYSTSNLNPNPVKHHPSIADVEAYYAYYGMTLTYRGWSEDVAGYPVISVDDSINFDSITTTQQEEDMPLTTADIELFLNYQVTQPDGNKATLGSLLQEYRGHHLDALKTIGQVPTATYNLSVPKGGGGTTTLATVVSWMENWVIQVLGGIAALKTGAASADIESVIKKAIAESIVTVDVKVEGIPKA